MPKRTSSISERNEDIAPLTAIRQRGSKVSNLWIFQSPKNNRRFTVATDVAFMHLILLEGDTSVVGYEVVGDPFLLSPGASDPNNAGYVRVRRAASGDLWLLLRRAHKGDRAGAKVRNHLELGERAKAAGASLEVRTELDLIGKEVLVDNWLTLCALITRAHAWPSHHEPSILSSYLSLHGSVRVSTLLAESPRLF